MPPTLLAARRLCLCRRLRLVAFVADRLQVAVIVCSALRLRNDVIHLFRWPVSACCQIHLAQALVAAQDALALLVPLRAVTAFVAAASSRIGE